jgi:hypothetical protein
MKRFALTIGVAALVAAVPAWAAKPPHPTHPTHPTHPAHPSTPSADSGTTGNAGPQGGGACKVQNKGFDATGTLVSAALTPGTKKGHFNGSITVDVTRANHKGATGTETFTLSNARVAFGKGVVSTAPAAGDRVSLHGRVTTLAHECSMTGFTATTTIRDATVRAPRKAGR